MKAYILFIILLMSSLSSQADIQCLGNHGGNDMVVFIRYWNYDQMYSPLKGVDVSIGNVTKFYGDVNVSGTVNDSTSAHKKNIEQYQFQLANTVLGLVTLQLPSGGGRGTSPMRMTGSYIVETISGGTTSTELNCRKVTITPGGTILPAN
jgi:hypothetical protein